jgi:hypothetical protein
MIAAERERDPENARRELDAEFMPTGSGHFFDHYAVGRCATDSVPLVVSPPHTGWRIGAGFDPAYVRDAAEGVIVRTDGIRFEVVEVFTRIPTKGHPLIPSQVDAEYAALVRKHGGEFVATDAHYRESVREHTKKLGVSLLDAPPGNAGKVLVFSETREAMNADRLRWSSGHRRLTRQANEIISKPLPGGLISISSPRRRGDHGDAIHALCLACWAATTAYKHANRPPRDLNVYSGGSTERSNWGREPREDSSPSALDGLSGDARRAAFLKRRY